MLNSVNKYLCLAASLIPLTSFALETDQSFELSLKTAALGFAQSDNLPSTAQDPEYNLTGELSGYWNLLAYTTDNTEVSMRYGIQARSLLDDSTSKASSSSEANFRADDVNTEITLEFSQNLDQLSATWYSPLGDYTFGRQPISFGQAKIYSPIDVVLPKNAGAPVQAYRAGVDALRATWVVGAVSELEAGYVFGEDSLAFARLKAYGFSSDWELIGLSINNELNIISLGTNGGLGAIGVWQETAILADANDDYLRATIGADYTFFDDLYAFIELHYNGVGAANNYSENFSKKFYQLGTVAAQAKWYSSVQASYPLNIASQLNVGATFNLNDGSSLLNGALSFNASDTLSINANATVPVVSEVSLNEEFSLYPNSLSVSFDWVF